MLSCKSVIANKWAAVEETVPECNKTFFMLSLAEHEVLNAHKYKILRNSAFFSLA